MRVTIIEPFGSREHVHYEHPSDMTLGMLLGRYTPAIEACCIDGELIERWSEVIPDDEARVDILLKADGLGLGAALGATGLAAAIIDAAAVAVIGMMISMALQFAVAALFGNDPGSDTGSPEAVFGIAGLTNTTSLGTPKILVYGTRRVYGHIINTRVRISDDGKQVRFSVLYFMGQGEIQAISDVYINDTPISSFPGTAWGYKTGLAVGQTPFPEFPAQSQVFSDGRTLVIDTPIVYTTVGTAIDRAILILNVPFLFNINEGTGQRTQTKIRQRVQYRISGSGAGLTDAPGSPFDWVGLSQSPLYKPFEISFPSQEQWEIHVTAESVAGGTNEGGQQAILYNVQEEISGQNAYSGSSLLMIDGVASNQIQSFEGLRASGMVQGLKVDAWNGVGFVNAWTPNRAWIIRDLLVHPTRGLALPPSLFNDAAALVAATYWAEQVAGFSGVLEDRDRCDILINERRPGWDWIRDLLSEGNASLVPSGGLLTIVIDRDKSPNLLYSEPGNIIEDSLVAQRGGQGDPPTYIVGEFPNEANQGILEVITVTAADCGLDASLEDPREETISLRSIVRESEARRKLAYVLKRKRLVQRRWTWKSPMSAMVSESFDVDSLSYRTVNGRRGFSGFTPAGSTVNNLLLDHLVELDVGTYDVMVRHLATNTTERRTVATVAGTWGQLQPTAPFTTAPAEGDIWSIGVQNSHILSVMIEDITEDSDGNYSLTASEYVPAIYTAPTYPAGGPIDHETPGGNPAQPGKPSLLPLPLEAAVVSTYIEYANDGSWLGMMTFDVTPGLPIRAGYCDTPTGDPLTQVYLPDEPGLTDFLTAVPCTLKIIAGSGAGQERQIMAYNGTTRHATVSPALGSATGPTSRYELRYTAHDTFRGFTVELQVTDTSSYSEWGTFVGTSGELRGIPEGFDGAIRFVPVGQTGVQNRSALWEIDFVAAGDDRVPGAIGEWA